MDKSINVDLLKDLPTVTREQALAFVDALVGWEDIGEEQAKPKSPHALTHFEAVLGQGKLTSSFEIQRGPVILDSFRRFPDVWRKEKEAYDAKVVPFIRYLLAVGLTLAEELEEVPQRD